MLEFFGNYPLAHYLKSMGRHGTPPKVGIYLNRDSTMMLVSANGQRIYWNGALREHQGAPGMEITEERKEKWGVAPSPYKREVAKKLNLGKGNEVSLIIEDSETYTSSYTVTSFETAVDLSDALSRDPSTIITAWKNYATSTEYVWEILGSKLEILRGTARLPRRVLLCGFPLHRAVAAAKWAEEVGMELTNLIPATAAVLQWALKEGPPSGFFVVVQTTTSIATAYIESSELKFFAGSPTKDGYTIDDVQELGEMAEDAGKGKQASVWCWGINPGSPVHGRIATQYKNLRTITAEDLRQSHPIEIADKTKIQETQAWLLDKILTRH